MKNIISRPARSALFVFNLSFLGSALFGPLLYPQDDPLGVGVEGRDSEHIRTVDHFVPHISTVPANEGERVKLFVRERFRRRHHHKQPVVLMVHGATTSTVPVFDLRFENYDWMDFLARAGFDVFAMDVTGYGLSPRPMMADPCNTSLADQQAYLIPNPLSAPCLPSYPFHLTTSQSEWDEIDTVVDYIRERRRADKVDLIGWSRGGPRVGGYAARHPEKVKRLFLYAPAYDRLQPSDPPYVPPEPGVPTTVLGSAAFFNGWDTQVKCENQFTPEVRDVIRSTVLEFDPLGRTWGTAGVRRAPVQNTRWGWNATFARKIEAPTLLIRGDLDSTVGGGVAEAAVRALYADLTTKEKVFVHAACASHFFVWENQHMILLRASEEWLREGTFAGHTGGSFFVDTEGHVHEQ